MTMTTVIEDESNRSQSSGPTGMNEGVMALLKNHVTHLRTCAVGMLFLAGTLLSDSVVRREEWRHSIKSKCPTASSLLVTFQKICTERGPPVFFCSFAFFLQSFQLQSASSSAQFYCLLALLERERALRFCFVHQSTSLPDGLSTSVS